MIRGTSPRSRLSIPSRGEEPVTLLTLRFDAKDATEHWRLPLHVEVSSQLAEKFEGSCARERRAGRRPACRRGRCAGERTVSGFCSSRVTIH